MTDEKILGFFNIFPKAEKIVDTFALKIWVTFDFFNTLFCIGGLFLFKIFKPTPFIITCIICFSVSFIIFTIWSFFIKNPQQEHLFISILFFDMTLKSIYSTFVFSQVENEQFTMWHIVIGVFFFSLFIYGLAKKNKVLKYLENHTTLETIDMIDKSTNKWWIAIVGVISCIPAYPLSKIFSWHFDIGLGFCSWGCASIWFGISIGFGYNYFLMRKYKLVEILNKYQESSQ